MSDVTIRVGGRDYSVACEAGQEDHLQQLGRRLDSKLAQLGGNLSAQESQNLLFAALFVADDLHEAEKSVASEKNRYAALEEEIETHQRDARNALGVTDELRARIADLESELDGLQSAQQHHESEVSDIRQELTQRREEAEEARQSREASESRVTELEREREVLIEQAQAAGQADESLRFYMDRAEKLEEEIDDLRQQLDIALNAPPPPGLETAASSSGDMTVPPNLAPALERFADLLENCAGKLEQHAPVT